MKWVSSTEIQEVNDSYLDMKIEAGVEGKLSIPFLARFFAKSTASAKAGSSMKETLKRTVEPKLSELILHCNTLIND